MLRSPWIARSQIGALPHRARSQQRSGWDARVRPRAAGAQASVLREEERGGPRGHQAGHFALLSCSSFSEQTALTGATRRVTDFREREAERVGGVAKRVGGVAKLRWRQSGRERAPSEPKGRSGEVITATSSASADATQIQRLRTFRSAIIP